jgi:hypothetical protein
MESETSQDACEYEFKLVNHIEIEASRNGILSQPFQPYA